MFNELCRLAMQEDLLEGDTLFGVDLTLMARYVDIAYNNASKAWFWVEETKQRPTGKMRRGARPVAVQPHFPDGTLKTAGAWHSVDPEEGVRQGGPYSCVLAALSAEPGQADAVRTRSSGYR